MGRRRTIIITLATEDIGLLDPEHEMGITNEAYESLVDAVSDAGFEVADVKRDY